MIELTILKFISVDFEAHTKIPYNEKEDLHNHFNSKEKNTKV